MAEINARTLMFNLGREDAIDSTTSAKIARYAERKQLAYKLTDEGVLLLHVRKMALVDPRLLKSLRENPTPLPDPTSDAIDTTLRDLDAEMTNILDRSDADESEKVRLYNQALLRYNDMTKARAAKRYQS